MVAIAEAVGKGGANKPVDVVKVQNLIDNNDMYTGLKKSLPVTGKISDALIDAIKSFQGKHPSLKGKKPDGKVDAGGKTLEKLNDYSNHAKTCRDYLPAGFGSNQLVRFNIDGYIDLYALQYPSPKLGAASRAGLKFMLEKLSADSDITDLRWAAYMLATAKHECANTWQPIEEYGKGSGKDYGKPVKVADPSDTTGKKKLTNTYYGRGYVQLTWESNYTKIDGAFALAGNDSLHLYPKNALERAMAYRVMSYGMRNGLFTGKKLADYLKGGNRDYLNARRIINGVDMAGPIRGYAENIEFLLRFCNGVPTSHH